MKNLIALFLVVFFVPLESEDKNIQLLPGLGFNEIKIGDNLESVQQKIGFGKKKSYNVYLADELFDRDPKEALECLIGFDHYIKYEYLLTLPIQYIFFKDDKVVQIKTTSFPEYYHSICEDVTIGNNIRYWQNTSEMKSVMGNEDLYVEEDYLILDTYHYFTKGVTFSAREKQIRNVHIYKPVEKIKISDMVMALSE